MELLIAAFDPCDYKGYACIAIALFHFIDYGSFWKFYFPEPDKKPGTV